MQDGFGFIAANQNRYGMLNQKRFSFGKSFLVQTTSLGSCTARKNVIFAARLLIKLRRNELKQKNGAYAPFFTPKFFSSRFFAFAQG
jgi:hypothetical protein